MTSVVKKMTQSSRFNRELLIFDGNDKDDYLNCFERIGNEIFSLCSCEVFPMLEERKGEWFVNYDINEDNAIGNLFGWAAHEDMNRLLMTAHLTESLD